MPRGITEQQIAWRMCNSCTNHDMSGCCSDGQEKHNFRHVWQALCSADAFVRVFASPTIPFWHRLGSRSSSRCIGSLVWCTESQQVYERRDVDTQVCNEITLQAFLTPRAPWDYSSVGMNCESKAQGCHNICETARQQTFPHLGKHCE